MEMEMGISAKWTDAFMRALTGCAVLLCAVGFVAPSFSAESGQINGMAFCVGIGLSAACALCLLLSNAAAADAPILFRSGRWFAGALSVAVFAGGAMVSMTSMHTGWTVFADLVRGGYALPVTDEQMSWVFGYVAFVKPVVNWTIQSKRDIKFEREMAERDKDRVESERRAARLAESEERRRRGSEAEQRRKGFHAVPKAALAATAAFGIPAAAVAESPRFPIEESARVDVESTDMQAHLAHGWKGPRDREKWNLFKEAVRRGMTQKEIAEELDLPTTTVHRWWHMMNGAAAESA